MNDVESFDAFYEATRTRLFHQMYAMTGNLADAQDCVQEAFARAWQHWGRVAGHDDPEAWLRTVAWRIAASRWRKLRNGVAALARHGPPPPQQEPHPDTVDLLSALKEIPESQRRAIVLHHLVGLSVEEVARETGAPTGTVKARLSRGRTALAGLLSTEPAGREETAAAPQTGSPPGRDRPGPRRTPAEFRSTGPTLPAQLAGPRLPLPLYAPTVEEGTTMHEGSRHVW